MPKHLIVVESPAKAKTMSKYLGKDFTCLASYGHVRDLIPKQGAVETENDFGMKYQLIEKNKKHVDAIVKAMKKADALYLATDPDREGEAISWHLHEILKEADVLDDKPVHRVEFFEITKSAIQHAIQQPRKLSENLINAQQARRALDYLVGFNLSPLLWKKVRRGLSAGRVQSPALRLIVEREEEIEKFIAREYWTIESDLNTKGKDFVARLTHFNGEKLEQFTVDNGARAAEIDTALQAKAQGKLEVLSVEKKQRRRNPAPPFTTSTLQQEASLKLGFSAQRTMRTAQQLYEGMDLGHGEVVGLISYMRTDAVNLANEAVAEIREVIKDRFGPDNLPDEPIAYKNKSKNAQEAHEAIRPTSAARTPDAIKGHLKPDQLRLYELIWKRTVACQMVPAVLDTVTVDLGAGEGNVFRANGSTVVKPGFMAVYQEDTGDKPADAPEGVVEDEKLLPPMEKGESVELKLLRKEQHFTEPPPRFSEASLVKALEAYGIGRPSTYASIIYTLESREYVTLDNRRFRPTDVGRVVNKFLSEHFFHYVDYDFTARMEDDLDAISRGEKEWKPVLQDFWTDFKNQVKEKESVDRPGVEMMEEECPKCGKKLAKRLGRNGYFIGCTGYPDCNYTRNVDDAVGASNEPEIVPDRKCPKCESNLVIKRGRYGRFIGCSNYPNCKHMEPLEKPADTGVECPECKQATMLKRKSRYGKVFYSCARYPDCKYACWNPPIKEPCPQCGWPILSIKTTKRRGIEKVCPVKECGFAEPYEGEVPFAEPPKMAAGA
ncbi:MAG: DNA topoisomerase I [Candidatus Muproteobacteria bacterium RIFCSPHIGHO2_12_FULL_60_33]|uniref:DNA topoisomerase 1 n=1 Tax=Candidatus Muproteobacteria bacterium RIFCSPLOWO2_01_FULL_60_18 TaxID=1817768 RepID=A0A1F6U131_9PROT|nr:MAG: DNA topoisomerase I [Candidatus Muproteobacteria bacterium RIFCSPLOWO2_01_FULL_60_18]OGI51093.1 MAG: DNA topoisomerase I [Candidatus Muproteobacteria bacterium RIFCSPHIGHO2_01_60_12]OGI54638.1 MAG: DNA topoisomerase I [Candidatus Muproteobacteria bacterium RIFCSPHIGHO2_02_FULL_60_13]OGI56150.1 MAG: DNA topoisomerase I [Candidatus Muproteobacteria bacterium RIFCSPHIGHO2_12_FULL_60_33]OGI58864.1 MAG: DNA topoisomerase I [Candidatus Muproteobacteria bacterium RIFCSPHIGHO2_01_FULL_61_200]